MDTINLNKADVDALERNYRKVIKSRMCLPDNTPSVAIYLTISILPFEAQGTLRYWDYWDKLLSARMTNNMKRKLSDIVWHSMETAYKVGAPWPAKLAKNKACLTP